MKLSSSRLALAAFAFAMPANAETTEPLWTLSTSGSWSEISSSDRDAVSVSISLSQQIGEGSLGASIGTSNGSDALFENTEITDRSSVFGSVWAAIPVGAAYVDLSVSVGQDEYDGELVIEDTRFDYLNGAGVTLVSEVDTFAIAAAVSRVYYSGDWDLVPNASLGWSQSDSTSTAASLVDDIAPIAVGEEQSGMTASAGLGIGYIANDWLYLYSDLVGLYAENGASTGSISASRNDGLRSSSRQGAEESLWAEVRLGASLYATDAVTLSLSGGTTAGRDTEEVFASSSLSVSF
ncbi:MAG: hypothetical protein AAFU81_12940 [Pseudomonadota bacterium]